MKNQFLNIDNSPIVSFAKSNLFKVALLATVTGVGFNATQPAQAQVNFNGDNIAESWWRKWEAGNWRQTYFGTLGPAYSAEVIRAYGSSSTGRAHRICTNYVESKVGSIWPHAWFFVAVQYNGDRFNCFYRKRV